MTNGEKIQTILNVDRDCTEVHGKNGIMTFSVSQDWWNAEYKESSSSEKPNKSKKPTGSDDCISRQDVLSETIRFSTEEGASVECQQLYCDVNNMSSVTPQEPKTMVEIDLYSVIKQKYIEREVLDKIREEIEQLRLHKAQFITSDNKVCIDSQEVLNIIDKYKAESEVEE